MWLSCKVTGYLVDTGHTLQNHSCKCTAGTAQLSVLSNHGYGNYVN